MYPCTHTHTHTHIHTYTHQRLQNNGKQAQVGGTQPECPDLVKDRSIQQHEKHTRARARTQHLSAHRMRNLPAMMVLAEHSKHRNVQLGTLCLLCGDCLEMARHVWECEGQSHIWRQRLHAWPEAHVGPRVAPVQRQLWDSVVLEQWGVAIATPSLRRVHTAGRTTWGRSSFVRCQMSPLRSGWPMPGPAPTSSKPRSGPRGTMAWGLQELQLHQRAERQGVPGEALDSRGAQLRVPQVHRAYAKI